MSDKEKNSVDFSLVLASSVHDMKNSLGMLLNSLEETMRETPATNPQQQQRFATLQYEASRINSELIQLLSVYRMNQSTMPMHVQEHYVIDILGEQLARNDMLFKSRGIEVVCECDEDLVWYFDDEMVGGVVHNILVNCARYTKNRLLLKAVVDNKGLQLSIADDGSGYPLNMIDQPVDTNSGVSFETGSTNLGLYFAQAVAQHHSAKGVSGHILLQNDGPLGGGVFSLFLP